MTLDGIKNGGSKNIEFRAQLPDDSKKYMKTIIAYANTSGGKIMIGIDDITKDIIGVDLGSIFQIMDKIADRIGMSKNGVRYVMNKLKAKGIKVYLCVKAPLREENGLLSYNGNK